jgi:uncharacterized metal-binding protein YceD (DUF177 family)
MLTVSIKGLADGKYPVEMSAECRDVENMFIDFFGLLTVTGTLRKYRKRHILELHAEADAMLICDVSGEEYVQSIETDFLLEYIADTHLAVIQSEKSDVEPPFYIRDDDTSIDITDEIRQEMAVRLPLKRVAPAYRGKEFSEIFPNHSADITEDAGAATDDKPTDPRWAALKNISFDK